jgi:hypothetical protein
MSFFRGWGLILDMKTNSINQKNYIKMFTTSILRCLKKKPNTCKNISCIFKYLNFIFKLPQILNPIQVFATSFKKHDYNNLAFEVHANKSLMYLKKFNYPHKVIYLSLLLLRDPNILSFTLLFVYTLFKFQLGI